MGVCPSATEPAWAVRGAPGAPWNPRARTRKSPRRHRHRLRRRRAADDAASRHRADPDGRHRGRRALVGGVVGVGIGWKLEQNRVKDDVKTIRPVGKVVAVTDDSITVRPEHGVGPEDVRADGCNGHRQGRERCDGRHREGFDRLRAHSPGRQRRARSGPGRGAPPGGADERPVASTRHPDPRRAA